MVEGRTYRTGGGRIEIDSVSRIELSKITKADALRAGYRDRSEILENVQSGEDRELYRVSFHRLDEPDPRDQLANDDDLGVEDIQEIDRRLDRYDAASSWGAWTRATLQLIADHPARRAPDLAEMVGRETKPFKLDVRKLKNLGLTRSLRVGYELSPRGKKYHRSV